MCRWTIWFRHPQLGCTPIAYLFLPIGEALQFVNPNFTNFNNQIKFICMILYLTSLLFVKLAILTLFYRIATLRAYTWFIIGVACVTIAAYLGSLISLLVQCTPVTNQWAINHPHCASLDYSRRWVLAQGSINITIEFVMLLFPIRPCLGCHVAGSAKDWHCTYHDEWIFVSFIHLRAIALS